MSLHILFFETHVMLCAIYLPSVVYNLHGMKERIDGWIVNVVIQCPFPRQPN